mgnify:CR=1 FL=1|jgi:hypothetical protein
MDINISNKNQSTQHSNLCHEKDLTYLKKY